ncbi:MAG: hypothetical protein ACPGUD_09345, partial [Parashewanella sp.]
VKSYMGIDCRFKLYMKVNSCYLPRLSLSCSKDSDIKLGQTAWLDNSGMIEQFVEMPSSTH